MQYHPREVLLGTEHIYAVPCEWLWKKVLVQDKTKYDPHRDISPAELAEAAQDDVFVCDKQVSLKKKVGKGPYFIICQIAIVMTMTVTKLSVHIALLLSRVSVFPPVHHQMIGK